jgi:mono/diheme cytochrome c family protein
MGRVDSVIGVGSARPRPIRLAREPKAWVDAAEKDQRMARAMVWFDWPERPAVDRGTKPVPLTAEQQASFERGKVVFARNCAQCHGTEGRGVPGQTPPLAGSPRATGDAGRAIRILLHGMDGSMERDGVVYNGQMPAAATLVDTEIADTLTYVRRSWGNAAAPVLGSEVLRVRMKTAGRGRAWTVGDIDSLPEEKP